MHILLVTSSYPSKTLKVSVFVHELARALAQKGQRVTVLAPHVPGQALAETLDGVRVIRVRYGFPEALEVAAGWGGGIMAQLRGNPLAWLMMPIYLLAMHRAAWALCRRERPDHLLAFWLVPSGVSAERISRRLRIPFSVIVVGSELTAAKGRLVPLVRHVIRRARAVFCISEFARERTRQAEPREDLEWLPMGVDVSRFPYRPPKPWSEGCVDLLVVGRLVPWKGTVYAIRAVSELKAQGVSANLTIVGDGPLRSELAREIEDAGLGDRVSFRANLSHDALVGAYHASHVLLQPSIAIPGQESEMLGVTLLEAQACGLNVVGSAVGGIPTAVINGETGILVEPGNAKLLADAVQSLIQNPGLRAELSQHGRARVDQAFSWAVLAPRLIAALRRGEPPSP